jgi:hypothetical protein
LRQNRSSLGIGALQFPQFVTWAFVSGVITISQFRPLGPLKQAKDSRSLYAKCSSAVALNRQLEVQTPPSGPRRAEISRGKS